MNHGVLLCLTLAAAAAANCACAGTRAGSSISADPAADPAAFTTEGPLKFAARPTTVDITPVDLMSRLYVFADDSMMGRDDGGPVGNARGTNYIAAELRRLGVTPAGENGTYFQDIGYRSAAADARSTMSVDGESLVLNRDFAPVPRARPFRADLDVVFAGMLDSVAHLTPAQARGKLVVLVAPPIIIPGRGGFMPAALSTAEAIAVITGDTPTRQTQRTLPTDEPDFTGPVRINVTRAVGQRLLGTDPAAARPGDVGGRAHIDLLFTVTHWPVRNVVGVIEGSDPRLRGEYIAIGAHADHVGFNRAPVDHDSLRAFNMVMRPRGANDPLTVPNTEQLARIAHLRDSLSRLHPARLDSIFNGADDDGSGSVALLEIAEAFAKGTRPKRSALLMWHAAEEDGLWGSRYFTDHPTVPRDSMVTYINMDQIGRGRATDFPGGGPNFLRVFGSRRASTELGDLVTQVNARGGHGFTLSFAGDGPDNPNNSLCRSDHYSFARYGIPFVGLGTGTIVDYHMQTDEPQYIDYVNMARRVRFVRDLALAIGDLDHRVVIDKPMPVDPKAPCR